MHQWALKFTAKTGSNTLLHRDELGQPEPLHPRAGDARADYRDR